MLSPNEEILFTRQRHEAEKMGLHWDYRLVAGDKAYSFATKKEMPEPGRSIVLFEQPVHDREYALSPKVVIPTGSYGAGVTTLDWVRKAKIGEHSTDDQMTINTKDGQRFLLKRIPKSEWGDKAWLFRNLGKSNKYLEKAAGIVHFWAQAGDNKGASPFVAGNRSMSHVDWDGKKHNPLKKITSKAADTVHSSKLHNALKGQHRVEILNRNMTDNVGRAAPTLAYYQFSKKDFTPQGRQLLNKRVGKSLQIHMEQLAKDPGRQTTPHVLEKIKAQHVDAFNKAYESTRKLRRNVKVGAGVTAGSAALGLAAYGANRYLKKTADMISASEVSSDDWKQLDARNPALKKKILTQGGYSGPATSYPADQVKNTNANEFMDGANVYQTQ